MTSQENETKSSPTSYPLPGGIELTPEATRLLNRQLSRNIVANYWTAKAVLCLFGLICLGFSALCLWGFASNDLNLLDPRLLLFIVAPTVVAAFLFRAAVKY